MAQFYGIPIYLLPEHYSSMYRIEKKICSFVYITIYIAEHSIKSNENVELSLVNLIEIEMEYFSFDPKYNLILLTSTANMQH